eukprot:TRINITY_DN66606_c4_g5_i1.p1 TRINITY_DN66606_c4_g5~~TRINITY_DN66606_c4_g5_i1.p1  ORF type:complete len:400 (+),score=191.64 TRINITY_DN66606_c4_g5_i1:159-1202(+)
MKEMDRRLARMKEEYARRIQKVKEGEERFRKEQQRTIDGIRRLKTFIIDWDQKRNRSLARAAEERKLTEKKIKEIENRKQVLESLKQTRTKLRRRLAQLKPNQEYLESVASFADDYSQVEELVTRYNILEETNRDLREQASEVEQSMEEMHMQMQQMMKVAQNDLLVKNSEIARLQKRLEDSSRRQADAANEVLGVEERNKEIQRRCGSVMMAIRNLYERTMYSREISPFNKMRSRIVDRSSSDRSVQTPKQRTRKLLKYFNLVLEDIATRICEMQDITSILDHRYVVKGNRNVPFTPIGGDDDESKNKDKKSSDDYITSLMAAASASRASSAAKSKSSARRSNGRK